MPTRAGHGIGTRALPPVVVHIAPLVLPVCEPPVDGAVAVRGDRVIRIGPRREIEAAYPDLTPSRRPGSTSRCRTPVSSRRTGGTDGR
ncbi:hypothetical protein SAMN05216275_12552 [Streptosporangium canum]|uniref:Aminodeoxyfutalosine deaminase/Imidazolonepropionase-like composite domain-containing protein n=1 Tax=Streptosporangium canum TaxID=324952 RepID=A0A1I3ZKL2_9ACTN|nr:hypothetical protein [Streptosporangium canum]SFK44221.1 hypothetical protein SAMN05216275_12552 [Streptosporangium canum]